MSTDFIKDAKGEVLGSIETKAGGEQVLRDAQGKIKGYYDPGNQWGLTPSKSHDRGLGAAPSRPAGEGVEWE